jgi:hypothetical protein
MSVKMANEATVKLCLGQQTDRILFCLQKINTLKVLKENLNQVGL